MVGVGDVTICVPSFGRPQYLERCLVHLMAAQNSLSNSQRISTRIHVLINGPRSAYQKLHRDLGQSSPSVHWFFDDLPGLSRARNSALVLAQSEYVAFVDDDAVVPRLWMHEVLGAIGSYPDAAIIGGPYRARFDRPRPKWMPANFGSSRVGEEAKSTTWVSGGNMILRRETAIDLGMFSDALGMNGSRRLWGEEADLCFRAVAAGLSVQFEPRLILEHSVKNHLLRLDGFLLEQFNRGFDEAFAGWMKPVRLRKVWGRLVMSVLDLGRAIISPRRVDFLPRLIEAASAVLHSFGMLMGHTVRLASLKRARL